MKTLTTAWRYHAIACLCAAVISSTASAQDPRGLAAGAPVPFGPAQPLQPPSLAPLGPISPAAPPGFANPSPAVLPQPSGPAAGFGLEGPPLQPGAPGLSPLPVQTPAPTQPPPLLSSQPPPFQVTPTTPAASNDTNFFPGNKSVQDLTSLVSGNFKDTKYKWYGFVRTDGIYDFRPMGSTDSFVTSALPVPQGRGQNSVITPRYTRFGFDTETPLKELEWTIKTRIEVDFFNGNTSGLFGSFPLRLRFAWVDFGPFLIGQAASLFMDYDVFPNVLDYQGPGGMVLMRQPIISMHTKIGEKMTFAIGVEQPYSDIQWLENGKWVVNPQNGIITNPGVARNVQDVPDVTANLRYVDDYGHVQLAAIGRKLTYQPVTGSSALDEFGYGGNVTATFHPWAALTGTPKSGDSATPLSKSRLLGQFAAGRGINRYLQDVNGLGLDATFDPTNGFRAIPSYGWFAAYEQWWTKKLASNFTYGQDALELTASLPGSTYQRANYVSANLIWLPVDRMGVGLEYLYGFRKNKDGQRGENSRIQMGFQYRF